MPTIAEMRHFAQVQRIADELEEINQKLAALTQAITVLSQAILEGKDGNLDT